MKLTPLSWSHIGLGLQMENVNTEAFSSFKQRCIIQTVRDFVYTL